MLLTMLYCPLVSLLLSTTDALSPHWQSFPSSLWPFFQPDSREVNPNGCYNVLLCEEGYWKNYTIDDLFPCDPDSGAPVFASGHKNEIWVQLLEKVYAKACGSYKRLVRVRIRSICRYCCSPTFVTSLPHPHPHPHTHTPTHPHPLSNLKIKEHLRHLWSPLFPLALLRHLPD